jgi:hypothetical protein
VQVVVLKEVYMLFDKFDKSSDSKSWCTPLQEGEVFDEQASHIRLGRRRGIVLSPSIPITGLALAGVASLRRIVLA